MAWPRNKMTAISAPLVALLAAGGGAGWQYQQSQDQLRHRAEAISGGSVERGRLAFISHGCGGCHEASGVPQAQGRVGPPLKGIAGRAYIAGRLENTPENLQFWIAHPQSVSLGTAMPELGVSPRQARDLAAFLYTQS